MQSSVTASAHARYGSNQVPCSDLARQIISCRCAGYKNATMRRGSRPVESFGCTLHSASLLACPCCLLLWSLHFLANHRLMIWYLCLCPACLLAARGRLCASDLCCSPMGDCPELMIRAKHAPASAKTLSACPPHVLALHSCAFIPLWMVVPCFRVGVSHAP